MVVSNNFKTTEYPAAKLLLIVIVLTNLYSTNKKQYLNFGLRYAMCKISKVAISARVESAASLIGPITPQMKLTEKA